MTRSLSPLRARGVGFLTAALAGLGLAGAAGVMALAPAGSHHAAPVSPARASAAGSPYFLCLAYEQQWGLCVGPPTN